MKPPKELLTMTPSPRPANATLPAGWHDSEVVQLDSARQQYLPQMSADAMDVGAGPSASATAQLPPGTNYRPGDEAPGWATGEELQEDFAGQFEAQGYPKARPSLELRFDRNGRTQPCRSGARTGTIY
ncbi:hypothetical protein V8F06_014816 [Rhypophila decipiens]